MMLRRRSYLISVVLVAAVVGGIAVATLRGPAQDKARRQSMAETESKTLHSFLTNPQEPTYPESWLATEADVLSAKVDAVLPAVAEAGSQNATRYYLWPDGGAIAVNYPLASTPSVNVRQEYIEVWASGWDQGDPATALGASLKASEIAGASMMEIGGIPVVAVPSHSPSDLDRLNPALLWFVVRDVQYQVSGGDNTNDLVAIAKDIIIRAGS
jgi:hypothetical protein